MFKDPITTLASDNSFLKILASIPNFQTYRLYAKDTNDINFPSFSTLLKDVTSKVDPEWQVNSSYLGTNCTTKINFMNTYSPLKPTFIFQHGLFITNHKTNLDAIISKSFYKDFNVVSLKAAWHTNPIEVLTNALATFSNTTLMLASSVHAIESVCLFHKSLSTLPLIVCGTSMGGINASNHYFYYNTADYYFPIVAYPNFAKLIINPKYAHFFQDYSRISSNKAYLESLEVPSKYLHKNKDKAFPILGTNDEAVPFSDASSFWEGFSLKTFDCGHFDIVMYAKDIREYILESINETSRA